MQQQKPSTKQGVPIASKRHHHHQNGHWNGIIARVVVRISLLPSVLPLVMLPCYTFIDPLPSSTSFPPPLAFISTSTVVVQVDGGIKYSSCVFRPSQDDCDSFEEETGHIPSKLLSCCPLPVTIIIIPGNL